VNYPAGLPSVIAVGGTTLTKSSNPRGWEEAVWYDYDSAEEKYVGTGSGCTGEAKPAWQTDPLCKWRTNNDVAAVADQNTPVSTYDNYGAHHSGWQLAGGTSVSAPIIAAAMALANEYTRSFPGADALYIEAAQNGTGTLDDVTSGKNVTGSCGSYLCEAGSGYDGPTGLGSLSGAPTVTAAPPTVTTTAATEVTEAQAVLNGTVDPNAVDTHYYFEYGTSTGYGSVAPVMPGNDAGAGTSVSPARATATYLAPGLQYHYRLVATNVAGKSYGNDRMFTTLPAEASSNWAVRDPMTWYQWVDYQGANEQVYSWYLLADGTGWHNIPLGSGEAVAKNTSPTVVRDSTTGDQWVVYQGTDGQIYEWYLLDDGTGWHNVELGGGEAAAKGTSPTVVRDPTTWDQWVYYQGKNGEIYCWYLLADGTGWHNISLGSGEAVAKNTSPTVVRDSTTGDQWVVYQGTDGQIYEWYVLDDGTGWHNVELGDGEAAAKGTSPTVVRDPTTWDQWIAYQGADGQVYEWYLLDDGTGWHNGALGNGAAVAKNTSPTVVRDPTTWDQWVVYQGPKGQIYEWYLLGDGTGWHNVALGNGEPAEASTSPTILRDPATWDQWVYYHGKDGQLQAWYLLADGTGWHNTPLGSGEPAAPGS
jgi:hypothetical protein